MLKFKVSEKLSQKNEELIMIPGEQGDIEAILSRQSSSSLLFVILTLQKGTMFNKVISPSPEVLRKGLSTLRFNYRGVGNSHGSYGHVKGEIDDALAFMITKSNEWNQFHLAGFSLKFYRNIRLYIHSSKSLTLVAPLLKGLTINPFGQTFMLMFIKA